MSYTVLARRYRSGTFDEVVGQNHVAQTLKKAISSGRVAHAYLFCGTRGTGKTSTARILAKALNCEASDKPTTDPCGKCESCKAIARGDDIDVIEIDAASNTGVDNIRELIENSQYRPARSRFKVYIIDEVHMLSKSAFNALLKTLEEPPEHVKFILATTEPEKVLPTILSRCQRYDFRNIPTREIAQHLASISKQEKIKADDDALLLVAKAGAGSMRDSLSLLDRLLSLGEKHLTVEIIESLLGLPKSQVLFELADAIGRGDVKATLAQTDCIIQAGLSVDSFLAALVDHLRNLLVLSACGGDSDMVEVPGLSAKDLSAQAQRFDAVTLSQDIAILEELRRQVRQSNAGRALLDATLVRLALAEQFSPVADVMNRVNGAAGMSTAGQGQKKKLEGVECSEFGVQGSGNATKPRAEAVGDAPGPSTGAEKGDGNYSPSPMPAPAAVAVADDDDDDDALPAVGRVWEDGPKPSLSTIMAPAKQHERQATPAERPAAEANVEAVDPSGLPGTWQALLAMLAKHGPSLQGLLSQGRFVGIEEGRAVIRYSKNQEMTVRLLEKNGKREMIAAALTELRSEPTGVRFEVEAGEGEATVAIAAAATQVAPRRATSAAPAPPPEPVASAPSIRLTPELRAELEADPLIRAVIEMGGNIVKVE
jgi:DNA polymerase III subunit gamma/tau